ncbi:MAG: nucleotidyl transferase AbiEii/AbiGii toxin family protein [Treponema sp.]|jgi:predicted nucleotidyltransferase component of viral defense system|nr:nucleotidyl transferase AbiEii/AbiGii toxin family protein [Treponema sp.]
MILPSQYYEESLYPLQDGVLNILSRSGTTFFLTGGTALSRAYYNHRYSDDLDFFLNQSESYDDELDTVLALLRENGFVWDNEKGYTRNKGFATIKVGYAGSDTLLKLDFVNDNAPLFGEIQNTGFFYRTDSIRNMLSNKLSAIFRYAAKDVVDIREIALHETVDWPVIIQEARQKEGGLELIYISEILKGMPRSEFDTVAWIKKPDWEVFCADIDRIVYDMISGA